MMKRIMMEKVNTFGDKREQIGIFIIKKIKKLMREETQFIQISSILS
jgi:hypothetical protein